MHGNDAELGDNLKPDGRMSTLTGGMLNLLDPHPDNVNIYDIGKGLSHKGHFSGQSEKIFTIAQHSVWVAKKMEKDGHHPRKVMAGLLHDGSEAYLGDMIKPIKVMLPEFCAMEDRLQAVIFLKFGLNMEWMPTIKPYDKAVQAQEYEEFYVKPDPLFGYWTPEQSFANFMSYYHSLQLQIRHYF